MSLVEYIREGRIGYITLNRPEKLNAISDEMSLALCDALYAFYDDEEAMIAILSGNGRAFCSGADVKQRQQRIEADMHAGMTRADSAQQGSSLPTQTQTPQVNSKRNRANKSRHRGRKN